MGNFLRISLDNNQSTVIPLHNEMTVLEVVENTCSKRQLEPEAYFLKLGVEDSSGSAGDSFACRPCYGKIISHSLTLLL